MNFQEEILLNVHAIQIEMNLQKNINIKQQPIGKLLDYTIGESVKAIAHWVWNFHMSFSVFSSFPI